MGYFFVLNKIHEAMDNGIWQCKLHLIVTIVLDGDAFLVSRGIPFNKIKHFNYWLEMHIPLYLLTFGYSALWIKVQSWTHGGKGTK